MCSGADCTGNPGACGANWSCVAINATDWACVPPSVCGGAAAPQAFDPGIELEPGEDEAPGSEPGGGPEEPAPEVEER